MGEVEARVDGGGQMTGNWFFLIEPRSNLVSHLRGKTEPDFIDILSEPVLIRSREGCRASEIKGYREAKVKLLFLARLREYDPLSSDAEAARLLGDDRISTGLFDRWWTIREFGLEEDAE